MNLNLYQRKNNHERELIELFKTIILHFMIFSGSLLSFLPALHKHAVLEKHFERMDNGLLCLLKTLR